MEKSQYCLKIPVVCDMASSTKTNSLGKVLYLLFFEILLDLMTSEDLINFEFREKQNITKEEMPNGLKETHHAKKKGRA